MPYALFDGERQIGEAFATEEAVWRHALEVGLVDDIPVADELANRCFQSDTTSRKSELRPILFDRQEVGMSPSSRSSFARRKILAAAGTDARPRC
jgi:hypothetical protein